jgi:hypothetical protein
VAAAHARRAGPAGPGGRAGLGGRGGARFRGDPVTRASRARRAPGTGCPRRSTSGARSGP